MNDKRKAINCSLFGWLLLSAVLVVLDQVSKLWIVNNIFIFAQRDLIPGFLSLFYCQNTGVAFSLFEKLSNGPYILAAVSIVLALIVLFFLFKLSRTNYVLECLCLSLILGGAIGNIIDRIRLQYVIDFIKLDFGFFIFPIFNFADCCAVIGCFLFIILCFVKSDEIDEVWNYLANKKETQDNGVVNSDDSVTDESSLSETLSKDSEEDITEVNAETAIETETDIITKEESTSDEI